MFCCILAQLLFRIDYLFNIFFCFVFWNLFFFKKKRGNLKVITMHKFTNYITSGHIHIISKTCTIIRKLEKTANKIKRIAMVPMEDLVDHFSLGQLSPQWPNFLYSPLFFSSVAHQCLPVDACLTHLFRSLPFHTKGNMHGLCLSLETVMQSTLPTTKNMENFEVHICKYTLKSIHF